ncbi:MAG: GyrI-like domain-containing protein [Bacteroidales bacterium]
MNQNPRLIERAQMLTSGYMLEMTLSEDRTFELWRHFMPLRRSIPFLASDYLISLQVYSHTTPKGIPDPGRPFYKWAAVEVTQKGVLPSGLSYLTVPEGLYAVFDHVGGPSKAYESFNYIFFEWLPASGYIIDTRPHFELLGEKYSNTDPESEEEIWIPVRHS